MNTWRWFFGTIDLLFINSLDFALNGIIFVGDVNPIPKLKLGCCFGSLLALSFKGKLIKIQFYKFIAAADIIEHNFTITVLKVFVA